MCVCVRVCVCIYRTGCGLRYHKRLDHSMASKKQPPQQQQHQFSQNMPISSSSSYYYSFPPQHAAPYFYQSPYHCHYSSQAVSSPRVSENKVSSDLVSSLLPESSESLESLPTCQAWKNSLNPLNNHQKLIPYQTFSILHCGHNFRFVKNKLLYNILRGRFNNVVRWVLEEIFIMSKSQDSGNIYYKGIITNILNTLKKVCVEQISPRCIVNVAQISLQIDMYESVSDFSEAVLLMTLAPKSEVCLHLLAVACDKYSADFQKYLKKYETINPTGDDHEDIQIISENIGQAAKSTVDDVELREQIAFIVGQMYRRKLEMKPDEDFKNASKNFNMNKSKKKKLFRNLWKRLLSLADVLGGKSNCLEMSVEFKKNIFESRKYFNDEILCIISAIESIFATARNLRLPLIHSTNKEQEKFYARDWIVNHKNVIKENEGEEEEEEEEEIENEEPDNQDKIWSKTVWKMKYEKIQDEKNRQERKRKATSLSNEYKRTRSESVASQL